MLGNDHSWKQVVRSVPQEWIQDPILESFDVHLDGVDPFEILCCNNVEQGPDFDIDRTFIGNPRLTQVFRAFQQFGGAVPVSYGTAQHTNGRSRIQSDVVFKAPPYAGVRLDCDDPPAFLSSGGTGDPQGIESTIGADIEKRKARIDQAQYRSDFNRFEPVRAIQQPGVGHVASQIEPPAQAEAFDIRDSSGAG